MRRTFHLACFMYNLNKYKTPQYLYNLIISTETKHTYNTRSRLFINHVKSSYGSKAFANYGSKLWNSLPLGIKNIQSKDTFKQKLTEHLQSL